MCVLVLSTSQFLPSSSRAKQSRTEWICNAFLLRVGQVIAPCFKQKEAVEKTPLPLNEVAHAHQTQNRHLKNQRCTRVWDGDLGFAKQNYYIKLILPLSLPGFVVVFLFKLYIYFDFIILEDIYIYVHIYVYTYIRMYIYTYTYNYTHIYTHTHNFTLIHRVYSKII